MAESADASNQEAESVKRQVSEEQKRMLATASKVTLAPGWKAPPVQTPQTADQARQDARRANEEAAKRLIANPPEWAYPKAWMCAVLHLLDSRSGVILDGMREGRVDRATLEAYHNRRLSGMPHEAAKRASLCGHDLIDAYARDMDRPSPLMGRPGVKGGISTCDLGGEYE